AHLVHTYRDTTEKRTITRTINYHLPEGVKAVDQSTELTRPVTTDLVTGEKDYGSWTTGEFTSKKTPKLRNYTPSTSMVGSLQVEHGDADSQENVYYYPNKQKATITFVDAKTGKTIKLIPDFDSGKPNDAINFAKAKAQLVALLKEGYKQTADLDSIWKSVFDSTKADGENTFVIRLVPSLDMHPSAELPSQKPGQQKTATGKSGQPGSSNAAKKNSGGMTGTAGQAAKNLHPASSTAKTVNKTQSAKLPQTGEAASGKQLSWLGLVLAAIGTAFSGLWRKKRDDE
ncbi:mucin-binding protein, partial [Lactobacillus porci]|uniref:mucin-binding protein n=2 Tax=Lactobacillus porci TaxID=2012477 RepID=UPI00399636EF